MTGRKRKLAVGLCLTMLLGMCTPLVSSAAAYHPTVGAAVSTNEAVQVVSIQAELEAALAKTSVKQIVIKTGQAVRFEIPKGNYSGKKLIVRAPKAEINNAGTFKSVTIYGISDQAYVENADHNKIRIMALSGKIVVPAGKTADSLTVAKKNSRVKVEVGGTVQQINVKRACTLTMEVTGSIKRMNISATSTVTMNGSSRDTTIVVGKAAKNSRIIMSAPATVKLKASATVTLKRGAEDARLVVPKGSGATIGYTLVNETDHALTLNTSSGKKTLAAGKSYNGKEDSSSGTTIMGGGSGGSSGGSGSGSAGKPGDGEEKPVVKKELPAAAEVLSVDSFCVYVDAAEEPGALGVKLKSGEEEIELRASTAAAIEQTKVVYTEDGRPKHVYGYCYTYNLAEDFRTGMEYTVSIGETETYRFEEQKLDVDVLREALKPYEDQLRELLEETWLDAQEGDGSEKLLSEIEQRKQTFWKKLFGEIEADQVNITISIGNDEVVVNGKCPLHIRLEKGGIDREFICEVLFVDQTTDKGKILVVQHYILNIYKPDFEKPLSKLMMLNMPGVDKWESNNPSLIKILDDGYQAEVTLPGVGVEEVILKAYVNGTTDPVEKTIILDSGKSVGKYSVEIKKETEDTLKAIANLKFDGKSFEVGTRTYQWYRMQIGSSMDIEELTGATGESCKLDNEEEGASYWYFCKVTNTVSDKVTGTDKTSESYSECIRVTVGSQEG